MEISKTTTISVIICAYTEERWHNLTAAIASIQQQTVPPCEIILVIDHNTRLLERVRTKMHGVIVIENTERRGLSGARNCGIAIAKGTLIAFLDDDAIAKPDWLMRLCHCCEDPLVLGTGGTVQPLWQGKRPAWFPEEFFWVIGCSYRGLPQKLAVVRNPYGGSTCFRREVFEGVGGFTNGIGRVGSRPLGGEETELCIRARQHWPQRHFLFDPQAVIHHCVPSQRATWRYFRSRCYAEGLSKALIAMCVGAKGGLGSERSYTLRVLPSGVVRGVINALVHLDRGEFMKACAIICGFAITTAGYLVGTITQRKVRVSDMSRQNKSITHVQSVVSHNRFTHLSD